MKTSDTIFVAGHRGLAGSAIVRALTRQGYDNLILRSHTELDLTDQQATALFFKTEKPAYVFLAAAKVGGIMANATYPAEFIYQNLQIQSSIIHEAYRSKVTKLLFLGSSCIYPKLSPQPIKEEYLLTGGLEPTNEPYAIAKIAGLKLCQSYNRQYGTNFIAAMPTNLYGPGDNFGLQYSHVVPALIRKFHEAKVNNAPEVIVWGTGSPRREFLYADDMAEACLFLMQQFNPTKEQNDRGDIFMNVGTGEDITIQKLTEIIGRTVDYGGTIRWDTTKPDGTPRKLLATGKLMGLGWNPTMSFPEGIKKTYEWYLNQTKS